MGKIKFTSEFVVRSSPGILFNFLTSSSNLAQWFSETCNAIDGVYTFGWEGSEESAERLEIEEDKYVKYQWEESEDGEYFDFTISKSEISNDTILTITDFAEDYDVEDQKLFWENQINALRSAIGAG